MAKTPTTNTDGDKPTTVKDANGNPVGPPATTGAPAPVLDPESDLGKAAAIDAQTTGAIRAEDNAGEGVQPDGSAEASPAGSDPSTAEMITVETTGDFMLHDPYSLDTVASEGTSEVRKTAFTDAKIAAGQLKLA